MLNEVNEVGGAAEPLTLIYRGTLSSCNYDCQYCPFAKRRDNRAQLVRDAAEVARFTNWISQQTRPIHVLFTPWGEALVRRHYRHAMAHLADMPHVGKVVLQTNLSGPLKWLASAPAGKIELWCTFHPSQTTQQRFLARCAELDRMQIDYSVGIVATHEHFDAIRQLRQSLPAKRYLWLNAFDRRGPNYYRAEDLAWLDAIDPWFHYNRRPVHSFGKPCRAGQSVIAVDGDGEIQRCHFLPQRMGNLYRNSLADILQERPCNRAKCDCFIGYAHRNDLPFYADFDTGVLARIPKRFEAEKISPC